MQGNLSEIGLIELLVLATNSRKTGVLKLAHGKESVEIFLNEGRIVHATCPIGEGEKAILYPVTWSEGNFQLHSNGTPPAVTVQKSGDEIIAEVRAMAREWEIIL